MKSNHLLSVAAVCRGGMQRHIRLTGWARPSRPHPFQLTGLVQIIQSKQTKGGVSVQGGPQQEKKTEEQTTALTA